MRGHRGWISWRHTLCRELRDGFRLSTPWFSNHRTRHCRKVKGLRDNLRKIAADLEPAPTALLAGLQSIHRGSIKSIRHLSYGW